MDNRTPFLPVAVPALLLVAMATLSCADSTRYVIWKFDDLRTGEKGNVAPMCSQLVDWAKANHTPITLGIICNSLTKATAKDLDWIKSNAVENGGVVEFWNHGWDHAKKDGANGVAGSTEFSNRDLASQTKTLTTSCAAMLAATGLTFRVFGAPYNASDATTEQALDTCPNLKVWLYGNKTDTRRCVLGRSAAQLEFKTGKVAYDAFVKTYTNPKVPCLVLQGHPPYWDADSFAAFTRIAALLTTDGWKPSTALAYATAAGLMPARH